MADEFPSATVYDVDLSPIQPEWVPSNCKFQVDDYEDQWTYREEEQFDYIHGRALGGTSGDWARFYEQVMENLKPGGWVEMQEYEAWIFSDDDSCDCAPWTMEWVDKLDAASKMYGKQINVAQYQKQWMMDAGFEDVQERVYRLQENGAGTRIGLLCLFGHEKTWLVNGQEMRRDLVSSQTSDEALTSS